METKKPSIAKELIKLVKAIVDNGESPMHLCRYLFGIGKIDIIREWWKLPIQYHPKTEAEWVYIAHVFTLLITRNHSKILKKVSVGKFQTEINAFIDKYSYIVDHNKPIFRNLFRIFINSPGLKVLYPGLLSSYNGLNEKIYDVHPYKLKELIPQLVLLATSIPDGTEMLSRVWKNYKYDINAVWTHNIDYNTLMIETERTRFRGYYSPFLNCCRYGSPRDLNFWIRHTDIWLAPEYIINISKGCYYSGIDSSYIYPDHNLYGHMHPLKCLIFNANIDTIRKFVYQLNHIYDMLINKFGANIAEIIWNYYSINKYVSYKNISDVISLSLICKKSRWNDTDIIRQIDKKMYILLKIACVDQIQDYYDSCSKYLCMHDHPIYNMYTEKMNKHTIPKHIDPIGVFNIALCQNVYLTPKADGIFYQGKLPQDIYPSHNIYHDITAEKIRLDNGVDLYLVYDGYSEQKYNLPLRQQYLIKMHKIQIINYSLDNNTNSSELLKYQYNYDLFVNNDRNQNALDQDNIYFKEFIATIPKEQKSIWWVKRYYSFYGKPFIANIFSNDTTHKTNVDLLQLLDNPPQTPYPNDGWIVLAHNPLHNKTSIIYQEYLYKVKPYNHLTIDKIVDTNNATIGRYKWEKGNWVFDQIREDKKKPNDQKIIDTLTNYHKNPWYPSQIIPWLDINKRPYYQDYTNFIQSLQSTCNDCQVLNSKNINTHVYNNNNWDFQKLIINPFFPTTVINCGVGYKKNDIWNRFFRHNPYTYVSIINIDIDPYIVSSGQRDNNNNNYYWLDMVSHKEIITNNTLDNICFNNFYEIENELYSIESHNIVGIFIHSIHFACKTPESFFEFMTNTNKLLKTIYIEYIDIDVLKTMPEGKYNYIDYCDRHKNDDILNKNYIKYISEAWCSDIYLIERSYDWNNNGIPTVEIMMGKQFLVEQFQKYGWVVTDLANYSTSDITTEPHFTKSSLLFKKTL